VPVPTPSRIPVTVLGGGERLGGMEQFCSGDVLEPGNGTAVGSTMPFSKYTCEPDLMEAMRAAFYRVCDVLQLSCDREDPLTEIVVTKIVELAKAGERDPEILCFTVLAELDMPLQEAIPRSSSKVASVVSTEVSLRLARSLVLSGCARN
jgi:hypothetical protein